MNILKNSLTSAEISSNAVLYQVALYVAAHHKTQENFLVILLLLIAVSIQTFFFGFPSPPFLAANLHGKKKFWKKNFGKKFEKIFEKKI